MLNAVYHTKCLLLKNIIKKSSSGFNRKENFIEKKEFIIKQILIFILKSEMYQEIDNTNPLFSSHASVNKE